MELPTYRLPMVKSVLKNTWDKCRGFIIKAGTIIFAMSIVIWFLQSFTPSFHYTADSSDSIFAYLGGLIAPILAPFGITINNVAPGAIDTPRNEKALENDNYRKTVEAKIPCGFIGKPEDVSPAVLLLASEEGRYITGAEIKVDGGMSL